MIQPDLHHRLPAAGADRAFGREPLLVPEQMRGQSRPLRLRRAARPGRSRRRLGHLRLDLRDRRLQMPSASSSCSFVSRSDLRPYRTRRSCRSSSSRRFFCAASSSRSCCSIAQRSHRIALAGQRPPLALKNFAISHQIGVVGLQPPVQEGEGVALTGQRIALGQHTRKQGPQPGQIVRDRCKIRAATSHLESSPIAPRRFKRNPQQARSGTAVQSG